MKVTAHHAFGNMVAVIEANGHTVSDLATACRDTHPLLEEHIAAYRATNQAYWAHYDACPWPAGPYDDHILQLLWEEEVQATLDLIATWKRLQGRR